MTKTTESRPVQNILPEKRQFIFDGATTTVAISGDDNGGELAVIHAVMPPGAGSAPHVHSREEETAYVLKGILQIETAGQIFHVHAGSAKVLPRSIPHRLSNASNEETHMLLICTPAGFEKLVRESAEYLEEQGVTDGRPRKEDQQSFEEIAAKHGVSVVPEGDL